ncbi:hypothetical protein [Cloacibacillus porcorum]|nr:hypothetical protein [Cloacibacillus porcorum]
MPSPYPPQPNNDSSSSADALTAGAILGAVLTTVVNNAASN